MNIPPEYKKLRKLFSRKEKLKIILLFVMMMVGAVLEVAGIGMVPAFVAIVANPEYVLEHDTFGKYFEWMGIETSRELLIYGAVGLVSLFFIKNTYLLFYRFIEARFIYARRYVFSTRLMTAYLQAPYTFFLERNTAELLRNTTGEVNLMINSVLNPTLKILKEGLMATSIVIFLLILEPTITLFVTLVLGGMASLFLLATQKRMKRYSRGAQRYRKEMIKTSQQAFGGIKDARVMNREPYFIKTFRRVAYESSQLQRHSAFIKQIPRPVVETIAVAGIMSIAVVMHLQGRPIANIVPVIALFGVAIVRLMPTVQIITQLVTDIRFHIVSVNPVYDDLMAMKNYSREFVADRKRKDKTTLADAISIRDLHYHYPNSEEQALNGVSLDIPKGKAIAFVGPSGAGKTTIVDVLLGLLEPQKGEVLVDGKNIFDSISGWQRNIGYIPQFIYLSDDTMRRNIAFGISDDKINEEKLQRAVEKAQLSELVNRLPKGLDTVIGERGTRLSGGQRQRIGIARALYHDPQVLVMDEATSALDNITEKQIIDSIDALKGERTIVMIAHRLTTVMNCDQLYLMENGRITDEGTYAELLAKNARFREMAMEKSMDD